MRRTTLIVRDSEASLALYRDGLGMEVIYDKEINRPHSSEDREQRRRVDHWGVPHGDGMGPHRVEDPDPLRQFYKSGAPFRRAGVS